ncbi:MAG: response regulator [Deltaproteobacteria bacterium]|nr:response regulator [Deltaproteobacteria bacterium]
MQETNPLAYFRKCDLFSRLQDAEIEELAGAAAPKAFSKGAFIIQKDAPGDDLYLIVSGCVKVTLYGEDGRELVLAELREGEFFGEMSLLDGKPRSAMVIALEPTEVLVVRRRDFLTILNRTPAMGAKIIEALCQRVRQADEKIERVASLAVSMRPEINAQASGPGVHPGGAARVLVVDDHPEMAELLGQYLSGEGYEVEICRDGKAALGRLRAQRYDLVLTDLKMPGTDGLAVAREARAMDPEVRLVIMTGYGSVESAVEALKVGANDYLRKPFTLPEVGILVARTLETRRLQQTAREAELWQQLTRLQEDLYSDEHEPWEYLSRLLQRSMELLGLEGGAIRLFHPDGRPQLVAAAGLRPPGPPEEGESCALVRIPIRGRGETLGSMDLVHAAPRPLSRQEIELLASLGRQMGIVVENARLLERLRQANAKLEAQGAELATKNARLEAVNGELSRANDSLNRTLRELQEAQVQLVQSEKLASIGHLAAGVAHEINNPMAFIHSNLATLQEYADELRAHVERLEGAWTAVGPRLDAEGQALAAELAAERQARDVPGVLEDLRKIVAESKEGAERVKKIVLDLRTFSHADESEQKEADINEGIESTLNLVRHELKYRITVVKDLAPLPAVRCHPQRLNQVFMNLLVNAAQAIDGQGTITLRTARRDGEIVAEVSDTGVGIPHENLPRLFNPFFTTKPPGKGTGLGLSTAYKIVQDHGGRIEVESEPGQGTTFRVILPVEGADAAHAAVRG